MIITVGVDLGKTADPTAIVVCEYAPVQVAPDGSWWESGGNPDPDKSWREGQPDTLYRVRAIQRQKLGTSYPVIARGVNALCQRIRTANPAAQLHVLVDQTGVGRPVVDMMREYLDAGVHLTGVNFTGTAWCDSAPLHRLQCSMGKAYMVVRLQTTLQKRLLHLPKGAMITDLLAELTGFEVRTSITGHDTYGAFKTGEHDDLVCALGLAILGDAEGERARVVAPGLY